MTAKGEENNKPIVTTTIVTEKRDSILVLPGSELSVSAKFQDLHWWRHHCAALKLRRYL